MKELRWGVEPFNAAEWDSLNDAAGSHPHLHSINVLLLLKHFGTGKERIWVCRRGRNAVAMTVLTGRLIAHNFHPDNQTVALWIQQDDVDFGDLLVTLSKRFLMLSITHLDPDMLRRPAGHETVDYIETARTVVAGTFDDYWSKRPKSLRDNIKKYGNRLQKENIEARFVCITDAAAMGEAVNAFGRLESVGWKAKQGTAISPDNAQGAYYRELLNAYAAHGWASIWECYYGDKLVASNLFIQREGTVVSLKITYDEAQSRTSPSLQQRHQTFRQMWTDVDAVEYYGKEPGWHGWETERRKMYHVNAFSLDLVRSARDLVRRIRRRNAAAVEASATAKDVAVT